MRDFSGETGGELPDIGGHDAHYDTYDFGYGGIFASDPEHGIDVDDDPFSRGGEREAADAGALEASLGKTAAVALLERTVVDDIDDTQENGTLYYSPTSFEARGEDPEEGAPPHDTGGNVPPEPPDPPRGQGSPYPEDEPTHEGGEGEEEQLPAKIFDELTGSYPVVPGVLEPTEAAEVTIGQVTTEEGEGFDWLRPSEDRPRPPAEPIPEPAFMPEGTLLRRVELMTRMGVLKTYFEGVGAGRADVAARRLPVTPAPERPPEAAPIPVAEAEPETGGGRYVELVFDSRTGVSRPDRPEPAVEATDQVPHRAPEQRPAEHDPDPDPWSSPADDETLAYIVARLRRPDVGTGQVDPTIRDRAEGITVEEPTPEEIAAAGGDVMAARAEKIARRQQEQRDRNGQ